MPTVGNGNEFFCDRCGMGHFRDYNEALNHEMSCDPYSSRKRRRPAGSPTGNMNTSAFSFPGSDQLQQHQQQQGYFPNEVDQKQTRQQQQMPSMKPPVNESRFKPFLFLPSSSRPPEKLSPADVLTCQNVEVYKASAADVADHEGSGGMIVNKGQLGFRCVHCAKNPFAKAEYASVFPGSLGTIAASLQLMTQIHFERCMAIDQETRSSFQTARNSTRGNDEEWYRESFVEFCLERCKSVNVINRTPAQTGIVLGNEMQGQQEQSFTGFSYEGNINSMQSTPLNEKSRRDDNSQHALPQVQSYRTGGDGISSQMSTSSQFASGVGHMEGDNKRQSSISQQLPSIASYSTRTRNGSPPSLYDSPGSVNFPFFQNQQGCWECRFCWGQPYNQRPKGFFWQAIAPPNRSFMEQHLTICQNRGGNQGFNSSQGYQSSNNQSYYNQFENMNQSWNTPQNKNNFASPRTGNRPPRPPAGNFQYPSDSGMNSQQQYAYNQMQMYNQMHMYGGDMSQHYGYHGNGMFQGQNNMDPRAMYEQDRQMGAARSEAVLKAALEHVEKSEEEIEKRQGTSETALILEEDKALLTDYFFHIMKQLRLCRFSENDRKTRGGKRDNIKVGFGGLQCVHCSENQNSRKFFWSNVDRLANSFAEIPSHVLKCRRCPVQTKQALQDLKERHSEQMTHLPRGSQKVFFRRMWRRLHGDEESKVSLKCEEVDSQEVTSSEAKESIEGGEIVKKDENNNESNTSLDDNIILGMSTASAAKALADYAAGMKPLTRILLAIDEDKKWLSDMDCFVRSNLEVFCATQYDIEFAESDRKYPITQSQIGIRCVHCALSSQGARGTAVFFPPFISGIYESVREFQRIHLESCPCLPKHFKEKLSTLKGSSSLSSVLRRYYVEAAQALGIHDTDEGMRAGCEPKPVGWKEGDEKDLSESIRHIETSNQEFLSLPSVENLTKKRKHGD